MKRKGLADFHYNKGCFQNPSVRDMGHASHSADAYLGPLLFCSFSASGPRGSGRASPGTVFSPFCPHRLAPQELKVHVCLNVSGASAHSSGRVEPKRVHTKCKRVERKDYLRRSGCPVM